ncbi:MAG: DUF5343 domain-containing protein [Desulfobacula sp.]
MVNHLRKSFPAAVNADTLKKLGFAKKNESYVINTLRFIGVIDQDENKTEKASKVFTQHDDKAFQESFSALVKTAYSELFALHKDAAWALDQDSLITFFRQTDQASALVGKKQANTYKALASLSGHGEVPEPKAKKTNETTKKALQKKEGSKISSGKQTVTEPVPNVRGETQNRNQFGLTVRIEINLPAEGDQETYNRIFKSIRENLLNG